MGVVSKGGPPLLKTPSNAKGVYITRSIEHGTLYESEQVLQ